MKEALVHLRLEVQVRNSNQSTVCAALDPALEHGFGTLVLDGSMMLSE